MSDDYGARVWRYRNLESGYEFTNRLHLEAEIDGSPMVGGLDTDDGTEQLAAYVRYAEHRLADAWAADAVRIHWFVSSDEGQFSGAPWTSLLAGPTFLDEFTWPVDAETGERLDFFRLPVEMDRFPAWAEALAWTPAPFTPVIRFDLGSHRCAASRDSDVHAVWEGEGHGGQIRGREHR